MPAMLTKIRTLPKRRPVRTGAVIVAAAAALGVAAAAPSATAQPAAPQARAGYVAPLNITKQYFGSTTEPYTGKLSPTYRYTMTNGRGMTVKLLSYGAITQAIYLRGRGGHPADVVLGF